MGTLLRLLGRIRKARRGERWAAAVVAVALLLLPGCSKVEPQPLRFGSAPWRDGEASLYRITDRNGRNAGTVRYALRQTSGDGWMMVRETAAHGVQETIAVHMAGEGFRPRTSLVVRTEEGVTERLNAIYDGAQVDLEMTNKRNITTVERMNIPSDARDQWTLFMLARALPLATGYSTRLNVFLPIMGRQSRVTLTVAKPVQVDAPAGTFEAWPVTLDLGDTKSTLWIGVEPPHPLVKYMDGANQGAFELAEFLPEP
jgi:hypothetical protein